MSLQDDAATLERAQRVVLGVVKAHQSDNPGDAALMITAYLGEETALGRSVSSAWAILFSASTLWLSALINTDAAHHHVTPGTRLTELSVAHALEQG